MNIRRTLVQTGTSGNMPVLVTKNPPESRNVEHLLAGRDLA
jgi:hypothetical protein